LENALLHTVLAKAGVFNRKSMEITTQEWHTLAFGAIQGRHLALTALSS